jgi:LysM repeat protein
MSGNQPNQTSFSPKFVVPRPPEQCSGHFYTVKFNNTLFGIAQRFGVTLQSLLAANPQITDRNRIYVGQVICIPSVAPPEPVCDLRVLNQQFLNEEGAPLPVVGGAVQLAARTIVRATFNRPVSRAFFFLEPTGTDTCELANLIGVSCHGFTTGVAEILWQVPTGTLGRVFTVACLDGCCAKSEETLAVRGD